MLREWAGEHGGGLSMRLSIDGAPPDLTPVTRPSIEVDSGWAICLRLC